MEEKLQEIRNLFYQYLDDCSLEEASKLHDLIAEFKVDVESKMVDLDDPESAEDVEGCPVCGGDGGYHMTKEEANAIMCDPHWVACEACDGSGVLPYKS